MNLKDFIPYSYNSIKEQDVEQLKTFISSDLPHDYRDFLMKYNGGHFEGYDAGFKFKMLYGEVESMMGTFFGFYTRSEYANIIKKNESALKYIPNTSLKDYLSIGENQAGHLICMKMTSSDKGSIYLYYSDTDEFCKVAETFNKFWEIITKNIK